MTDNEIEKEKQVKPIKMFNKAKDAPKILIGFGMVLYLFGFLSVSSFLAQFGIVSFDIVNSRFIIAGLFSFFSMAIALLFAWLLHKRLSFKALFLGEKRGERFSIYLEFISAVTLVSYALFGVFSLGKYSPLDQNSFYKFKPFFGKHDVAGRFVLDVKTITEETAYLQITVYLLLYVLILIFIYHLIAALKRIFFNRKQVVISASPGVVGSTVRKQETQELKKNKSSFLGFAATNFVAEALKLVVNSVEALTLAFFVLIFLCSFHNLVISRFDFDSFKQPFALNSNLMFSWFYTTVVGTFIFIKISHKAISWPVLKFDDFDLIHRIKDAFQFTLIPIVSGLIVFGNTIFPRIPFTIGGGEPREIELKIKNKSPASIKHKLF